ncbi:MAG: hypothetical protein JXR66_10085 [Bacteroidales bacterium]|nr:hypothetical protein [Bacteroidales bacterium]MBN2633895.1 hypothetical protein [Bacteroidales bacterium]
MDLNSTPFLSYRDIHTENTDLIGDAFGIYAQYDDVFAMLNVLKPEPSKRLTSRVLRACRKH